MLRRGGENRPFNSLKESSMSIGLTSQEAQDRLRRGQGNTVDLKTSRSFTDIFIANFLNIANVILLGIMGVLVVVGKPADALVTGGVVIVNIIIGTFQEYRSKRQLDRIALLTRPQVTVLRDGKPVEVDQAQVVIGDAILFKAGDQAVVDGTMLADPSRDPSVQRVDVDESLLTGESDLIPKRPGDEILSGSFAVVGEGIYLAKRVGNDSFAQKITSGARQYTRTYTPLQRQISVIVRALVVLTIAQSILLGLSYIFQEKPFSQGVEDVAVIISLIPQGLLLMITVAYALGAVRIAAKGALVQQINAVESLSHVDVLCLDKTGTLTTNRILFHALHPLNSTSEAELRDAAGTYVASTGAKNRTTEAIASAIRGTAQPLVAEIPFSSARKWSAASFATGTYILGAPEMLLPVLDQPDGLARQVHELAEQGLRVLLFAQSPHVIQPDDIPEQGEPPLPSNLTPLGLISFSDELRPHVKEVLAGFRRANIQLKLISGDNPTTVAALAYQAGFAPETDKAISGMELTRLSPLEFRQAVRDYAIFGRITPEQKQMIVEILREDAHYVAMIGDGVNDVLSLKKAQVGVAMEDGSAATRAVADIVLLGNKFEVLPDAFLEGQRILNGMNDSTRLFLNRTIYVAFLIIFTGYIGSEFPFSPRHNFLLTTLPVGIPAFFLAYWAKTRQPKRSLIVSTVEFVIPTGISLLGVNVFLWLLYLVNRDADVASARSILTIASLLGGIWIIIIAAHERDHWYTRSIRQLYWHDLRRVGLAGVMVILFLLVMLLPGLRHFFEMTIPTPTDNVIIALTLLVWASSLHLIWRYDLIERLLIPHYGKDQQQPRSPKPGAN
jgi:cation-transporting ATPase E